MGMKNLRPHHNNPTNDYSVTFECNTSNNQVVIDLDVKASSLSLSEEFSCEGFGNWGLWDYDVVEVFLTRDEVNQHYIELQVSALSQKFALLVKKPRLLTESFNPKGSIIKGHRTSTGFSAQFCVDASDIPGSSSIIKGNFFSCLGPKDGRCYFAKNINIEAEPDFHRPELFLPIGKL